MVTPSVTVFTPTFNRAHLLPRLHDSIVSQNYKNFEWLIVDDGSTDDTRSVVERFINEGKIDIRYFYKENGGKHTAVNLGVEKAAGELFFIIDSDDILADDALAMLTEKYAEIKSNPKICGIIALSAYSDGRIVGTKFPENYWQVSFADVYLKHKVRGDKAVAFRTATMRQFPFPEPHGIRFVFEAVVWHEMAKEYDVLAINSIFQTKEYLAEGLSYSSYKKWYLESLACSFYLLITNRTYSFLKYPQSFIGNYIHLVINSKLSGTEYFRELKFTDRIFYLLCYPRAYYSYMNLKKRIND